MNSPVSNHASFDPVQGLPFGSTPRQAPIAEPQTLAEKQQQVEQRQTLLSDLRERAAATGDSTLGELADRLERQYNAQEMASLAADVYDAGDGVGTAPIGYVRATADPQALREAGIQLSDAQVEQLLQPVDSGFRAEIYLPDPDVFGPDAQLVIAYRGSTPAPEDWVNNALQGVGLDSDYYSRAMDVAVMLSQQANGQVQLTGHSLGGGMASAAGAVIGAETTTFNSAGLHEQTVPRYMQQRDMAMPVSGLDANITAYQVEGDILTEVQTGIDALGLFDRARAGFVANTAAQVSGLAGINQLTDAQIEAMPERIQGDIVALRYHLASTPGALTLDRVPIAAGETVSLPALDRGVDANGAVEFSARGDYRSVSELASQAAPLLDVATDAAFGIQAGRALGAPVARIGQAADELFDLAGDGSELLGRGIGAGGSFAAGTAGTVASGAVQLGAGAYAAGVTIRGHVDAGLEVAGAAIDNAGAQIRGGAQRVLGFVTGNASLQEQGQQTQADGRESLQTSIGNAEERVAEAGARADEVIGWGSQTGARIVSAADAVGQQFNAGASGIGQQVNQALDTAGDAIAVGTSHVPTATAAVLGSGALVASVTVRAGDALRRGDIESFIELQRFAGDLRGSLHEMTERHGLYGNGVEFTMRQTEAEAIRALGY